MAGGRLASQPTVSLFENGAGRVALYPLGRELAASVIERHRRRLRGRVRRITIDLDPTDDPTHGAKQLTMFNSHYDSWCHLPLLAFVTFDREAEQYLCAAVLRPGTAQASDGTLGVLCRLLALLRSAFPKARFLVRLDGGFATPEVFDFLDAEPRLDYAYQPVVKVPDLGRTAAVEFRTLKSYGDGQEAGGSTGVADVGEHSGSADERWASVLRASEPGAGRGRVRRVRRAVVCGVLRRADGPPESAPWAVFPDAVDRLLRGSVVGARDCVAGGRFSEPAVLPGLGCDRGVSGSLDAVEDASADRRGDARGGVHVKTLRNLRIAAVPHGFRSSFRDWGAEMTDHPRAVIEATLAHVVQNKVEAAYARLDLFERRQLLMDEWAAYLGHIEAPQLSAALHADRGFSRLASHV